MKLKLGFGLGLACLACCAIPLIGLGGAAFGSAGLAASLGVSFDLIVCGLGLFLLAGALGWLLWQRKRSRECAACPTDGGCGCK